MVRYLNMICLLLCTLVAGSVAALSVMLLMGALFSGLSKGLNDTDIFAFSLLLLPLVLTCWSCFLTRDVYRSSPRLPRRIRYQLFSFYCTALIVSIWASTWTANRDGLNYAIFPSETTLLFCCFFFVPILSLALSKVTIISKK